MSIFDTIKYPISSLMTLDELHALPMELRTRYHKLFADHLDHIMETKGGCGPEDVDYEYLNRKVKQWIREL